MHNFYNFWILHGIQIKTTQINILHDLKAFFKTTIDGKISGKVYMFENIVAKIKRGLPWKCCSKFIDLQQDVKSVIPAIKSEKCSGFKFSSLCVLFALQGRGIPYRKNI